MADDDQPVTDRRLGTWAICVAALGIWFTALWLIFGDMF
jgi:hypothetical protein